MISKKLVLFFIVALNVVPGHFYRVDPPNVSEKHPEDCQCEYCQNKGQYNMPMIESRISDQQPYSHQDNSSEDGSFPAYFFDKHGESEIGKMHKEKNIVAEDYKLADLIVEEPVSCNNTSQKSCLKDQADIVTPKSLPDVLASLDGSARLIAKGENVLDVPSTITDATLQEVLSGEDQDIRNMEIEKGYGLSTPKIDSEDVAPKPETNNYNKTSKEMMNESLESKENRINEEKNAKRTEGAETEDKISDESFNDLIKYNQCTGCRGKEIISENSLEAVREIVASLRRNARVLGNGWVFRGEGMIHHGVVNEIVAAIESENPRTVRTMLDAGWRMEAAQALYIYLTRLEQSLIPLSIQSLVLDDNNRNISPEIVAADVLGLIREELSARHRTLIGLILDLLDCSIKLSPADELRGHTLPVSMMPLFFNIENYNFLNEWRRILTIFVELIRQGSAALNDT